MASLGLQLASLEELVKKAREQEDQLRDELRTKRRAGFHAWCKAESAVSMRALFPWVRDGPRSLQSIGVFVKEGRLYAGQAAFAQGRSRLGGPRFRS